MHGKLPIRMCVHYRYCNEGIAICAFTFNSEQKQHILYMYTSLYK